MHEFYRCQLSGRFGGLAAATALALTIGSGLASAQDTRNPNAVPVTITVHPNTPKLEVKDFGKAPFGATSVSHMTPRFTAPKEPGDPGPSLTVDVDTIIQINTKRINESYQVPEDGACKGVTFNMTRDYIETHEREHVAQIQRKLQEFLDDNLTYNERQKTFNLTGFGGPLIGAGNGNAAFMNTFNKNLNAKINQLVEQDKTEYEHKAFNDPDGMEHGARAVTCDKFMHDIGNQLNQLIDAAVRAMDEVEKTLKDAKDALAAAVTQAGNAKTAAEGALKAAKDCKLADFQKYLKQYQDAKKAAEDKLKIAQDLFDALPKQLTVVTDALNAYEKGKTNTTLGIKVTKFPPGDVKKLDIDKRKNNADASLKQLAKELATTGVDIKKKLADAADVMKQAFNELKKCKEAQDKDNKQWQTFIEEHKTETGSDGGTAQPPETPKTPDAPKTPEAPGGSTPPAGGSGTMKSLRTINAIPGLNTGKVSLVFQIYIIESSPDMETDGEGSTSPSASLRNGLRRQVLDWFSRPTPVSTTSRMMPLPPSRVAHPGDIVTFQSKGSAMGTSPLELALIATGNSTGQVFKMQASNPTGTRLSIGTPDGLIVQALQESAKTAVQKLESKLPSQGINGYCLQFGKLPPSAGRLYRVAEPGVQQQFAPMRSILQAGRRLASEGRLHPDSDPVAYTDAIKQWAIWSKLEKFDAAAFEQHFIDRTRKNAEALRQPWTNASEQRVRALVPNRWSDITAVLAEAEGSANTRRSPVAFP
jgi:hypothetical protein